MITSTCTVGGTIINTTLLATDLSACDTSRVAQLLSGHVNFASTAALPTAAEAEAPSGLPLNLDIELALTSGGHPTPGYVCYDDSPLDTLGSARSVAYFCAIYANPTRTWAGRARVAPLPFVSGYVWTIGTTDTANATERSICLYTTLPNDGAEGAKNTAHPLDYRANGSPSGAALRDQNFLVVKGPHPCPTDTPSASDPVNTNTRLHQSGAAPYT